MDAVIAYDANENLRMYTKKLVSETHFNEVHIMFKSELNPV